MKHDNTVAIGGSFFGGKTMSDEEKNVAETDFAQELTESGETTEEKKSESLRKNKRECALL